MVKMPVALTSGAASSGAAGPNSGAGAGPAGLPYCLMDATSVAASVPLPSAGATCFERRQRRCR